MTAPTTPPIRIAITGVTGRMGSTLLRLARADEGMLVAGATERHGAACIGLDAGLAARLGALEVSVMDDLGKAVEKGRVQVVIDFTGPRASIEHARICAERKVALVVGSTGFSSLEKEKLAEASQQIPLVAAPNMSVGVNLVIRMAGELAKVLGASFDVDILEAHHRLKKDAPSGTALRLAEEIAKATGRGASSFRFERHGQVGERPPNEIGLQTLRGGDVVGEHTVYFFGEGERVELTHRATSRDPFASGALRAARWVVTQPPGLYDMQNVLGFSR